MGAFPARPAENGNWTESAAKVLTERYLWRIDGKVIETAEEMCWRVAWTIASAEEAHGTPAEEIERAAREFYRLMVRGVFLPNSPTLMNAGKNNGLQYSACYVLPVEDSLEGIFDAIKRAAIIHQSGGGTGFSFSRLRSKNSVVNSTGGKASGPVSFLRVFNAATEAVKQGGTRRGANMGILRVDHPDILEFIDCKIDGGILNFNISVAITDEFMTAFHADGEYDLIEPHSGEVVNRLSARSVFEKLVDSAWKSGDPGVVFLDRINASPANPTPEVWPIEATNPCGEQPLAPNEACNLGSLNVAAFYSPSAPRSVGEAGRFPIDWSALDEAVQISIRFLDDVIDANPYPLPEINEAVKANRRVGLGLMGWADLLLKMGIPYNSAEAIQLAELLMNAINRAAHSATERLAEQRGPFPNWTRSIYKHGKPMRNSTVTTIAPTGTISIIAGCSSGIEPLFALAYSHIVGERHLTFVNPVFEEVARERGIWSDELKDRVAEDGTLHSIYEVPEEIRKVFVTAHEIEPKWHVQMQGAFQKHTDNAVSKTINLPNSATREDVATAYLSAYELGCLGITVFRDGCKGEAGQVLHTGTGGLNQMAKEVAVPVATTIRPRPSIVTGYTRQLLAPEGKVNVTLNSDSSGLFEVFINVGKAGSDIAALAEALGRLVSLSLRLPSPMSATEKAREIVSHLRGIGGSRSVGLGPLQIRSLPDAVSQALSLHLGDHPALAMGAEGAPAVAAAYGSPVDAHSQVQTNGNGTNGHGSYGASNGGSYGHADVTATALLAGGVSILVPISAPVGRLTGNLCPDCGCQTLFSMEGCRKCEACGYSEC